MQAGRAQPPTRWANPHRIPAIRRIAARDSETGVRGQPARASGAAKPAKTNQRRLPPLACAASSSFLAMVGTAPRPPPLLPRRRRPAPLASQGTGEGERGRPSWDREESAPMASPSCAPPPACVLLPPTAGESTVIGAPFSPLLPSRCHPIPQPPPQEQRGVSASGCGDGVHQV